MEMFEAGLLRLDCARVSFDRDGWSEACRQSMMSIDAMILGGKIATRVPVSRDELESGLTEGRVGQSIVMSTIPGGRPCASLGGVAFQSAPWTRDHAKSAIEIAYHYGQRALLMHVPEMALRLGPSPLVRHTPLIHQAMEPGKPDLDLDRRRGREIEPEMDDYTVLKPPSPYNR